MNRFGLEALEKSDLVELAERQADQLSDQARRIAELEAKLSDLDRRFEELGRRAMRGAAPFSRPEAKRKKAPKRPGRKDGHAGSFRLRPPDEAVDRWIEVPLEHCPDCGDRLCAQTDRAVEQTILEVPPAAPEVIRLVTHRNRCRGCGRSVASHHPLQVSAAQGAAGTHLGPRALAVAALLNKGLGLTMRKTCTVLHQLLGLSLTPGG